MLRWCSTLFWLSALRQMLVNRLYHWWPVCQLCNTEGSEAYSVSVLVCCLRPHVRLEIVHGVMLSSAAKEPQPLQFPLQREGNDTLRLKSLPPLHETATRCELTLVMGIVECISAKCQLIWVKPPLAHIPPR